MGGALEPVVLGNVFLAAEPTETCDDMGLGIGTLERPSGTIRTWKDCPTPLPHPT